MLTRLSVKNFVLIDKVELELTSGFSVLTGETGAGKSIILGAIGLILGNRAEAASVKSGAERADVVAEFDISNCPNVLRMLQELDIDSDECIVRRVIDKNGRSRAWINGTQATMRQLKELGSLLIDIHGQHEHYSLMKSSMHCQLLDRYGQLNDLVSEMRVAWRKWEECKKRLSIAQNENEKTAETVESLRSTLHELEGLDFNDIDWKETVDQHRKLSNVADLSESLGKALQVISEGDLNVLSMISVAIFNISRAVEFDDNLKAPLKTLEDLDINLNELNRELNHYVVSLDGDPQLAERLSERIGEVQKTARKYRLKPEQLSNFERSTREELDKLSLSVDLKRLKEDESAAKKNYLKLAENLSLLRVDAASALDDLVNSALNELAMSGSRFEVRVATHDQPTVNGLDQVEFFVATNPGSDPGPIGSIASGGELSRISLAIQSVVYLDTSVPTVIFDEVDSGIGGEVAETVGRMLKVVGKNAQVICVTHLPQVAALADSHLAVTKVRRDKGSSTELSLLDDHQRLEEIARMLAGEAISSQARAHAKELIDASSNK